MTVLQGILELSSPINRLNSVCQGWQIEKCLLELCVEKHSGAASGASRTYTETDEQNWPGERGQRPHMPRVRHPFQSQPLVSGPPARAPQTVRRYGSRSFQHPTVEAPCNSRRQMSWARHISMYSKNLNINTYSPQSGLFTDLVRSDLWSFSCVWGAVSFQGLPVFICFFRAFYLIFKRLYDLAWSGCNEIRTTFYRLQWCGLTANAPIHKKNRHKEKNHYFLVSRAVECKGNGWAAAANDY